MTDNIGTPGQYDLSHHGLYHLRTIYWNLRPSVLVEQVVQRQEGSLAQMGGVVVNTGACTGRSPNDKFVVKNNLCEDAPIWWGKVNQPLAPEKFERLYQRVLAYFQGRDVYVQDMQVGAFAAYRLPIRIITGHAWHSLFAHNLFIRLPEDVQEKQVPEFTLLHAPNFYAVPELDGTRSNVFIIIDFTRKLVLIGGSAYAGEIKKAIFSVMNYLMPRRGVPAMHCSANVGVKGDVALFFGLSGTGKTTLSSDPERGLIGDDEHGWGDEGIFNFEGGCYAKTIKLRQEMEPLIYEATRRFGTVIENVILDPLTRQIDFDSDVITENTRAAYPLDFIPGHISEGYAGHPENIFLLTADAFGVLPPLARLTPEQAMYYYLSGYTSKLAGTEKGLGKEPLATFSTCFGAPFLPLNPNVYARLLGEKIAKHKAQVWLINTGWTGGAYGVGHRIHLPYTRAMVRAALKHQLDGVSFHTDPFFGLSIPSACPEVPSEVLDPRRTWGDPAAYDRQAQKLVASFVDNFAQFARDVSPEVLAAGPVVRMAASRFN
jgi:phosphoenolpyruvate carboxykinase (ATP)